MKRMLFVLCLLAFAVAYAMGGGARVVDKTLYAEFATDTTGDTARVYFVGTYAAHDSFDYYDSIAFQADTSKWDTAHWFAPLFSMILTPTGGAYGYDSIVYNCSLAFPGGETLGVAYTSPEWTFKITPGTDLSSYTQICSLTFASGSTYVADWTEDADPTAAEQCDSAVAAINALAFILPDSVRAEDSTTYFVIRPAVAMHSCNIPTSIAIDSSLDTTTSTAAVTLANVCDTLAKLIEAETNLTDSVSATDSSTYVKITSLFGSETFGGRWSLVMTDSSLDSASHASANTVAMTTDSMVAAINGLDSAKYFTAVNSGDTAYIVTADDIGLTFWLAAKDTAQDTSTTQGNVTSVSSVTDTFTLAEFGPSLLAQDFRGMGVQGWIILNPCADTNQGFGGSDSAKIWLFTVEKADSNLIWTILEQDSCNSLPCSCRVDLPVAAANDTIFDRNLGIGYHIMDTLTDTVINAQYRLSVDLIITDGP